MPAARRALAALGLTLGASLLGGCALVPLVPDSGPPPLEFAYVASSGQGVMNQVLHIDNPTDQGYAPVLRLEALDDAGTGLPDVKVTTVYGSDRGAVVAPGRFTAVDVLRFDGPGAERVADVRATVVTAEEVDYPAVTTDPVVTPFDASGAEVTRNDAFTRLRITNDNADAVTVRLVYIAWNVPPAGRTQQAEFVVPIGDLVSVPARGTADVTLEPNDAAVVERYADAGPASIKAYFSH